jgi:diguanylate cyclase (GGDEF)-like protein
MADQGTEKQIKILKAMNRINRSLGVNLELGTIARILVEELIDIVGCTGCAIMMIDGKQVILLAEYGFKKLLGDQEFTTDMPAIKHIRDTGQCIFTGDIPNSPASSCVPAGCNMKSLICTPVMVGDEVRGIIHLDSLEKDAFDEEDKLFAAQLAEAIAIAMERALEHSKVKTLSVEDGLTGCYNRRKLDQDVDGEINRSRRYQKTFSLLMIDIDLFKKYNDHHGHGRGDQLLTDIATLFKNSLRNSDEVYRYGGDEFVILLPETDRKQAAVVAGKLQRLVEVTPFEGEEESQPEKTVTISTGLATYPWDGNNRDELCKSADTRLYEAKKTGRNRVCCYRDEDRRGQQNVSARVCGLPHKKS